MPGVMVIDEQRLITTLRENAAEELNYVIDHQNEGLEPVPVP